MRGVAQRLTVCGVRWMSGAPLVSRPLGPYSAARRTRGGEAQQGLVFVSGQIGVSPQSGELVDTHDVAKQTSQALVNISNVLKAGGLDMSHVVKTSIFLKDIKDFNTVNDIYAQFFSEGKPARVTCAVAELPKSALVEIDAIAYEGGSEAIP